MSIELDCPLCYRQWKVRDDQVNRRTSCPGCDEEYYVPEKLGMRGGREDDEEDEPASRGLPNVAIIGIVGGMAGLLLVASFVTAVVLARKSSKTPTPVAQGAPPITPQARPAPVPPGRGLTRAAFHQIFFNDNRLKVERILGPGTPIAGAELREHVVTKGPQGFLVPVEADLVCNNPAFAFYKWQGDRKVIYAAFNSKEATGVLVCAVYVGPDVPFNKVSEFTPNLSILHNLR